MNWYGLINEHTNLDNKYNNYSIHHYSKLLFQTKTIYFHSVGLQFHSWSFCVHGSIWTSATCRFESFDRIALYVPCTLQSWNNMHSLWLSPCLLDSFTYIHIVVLHHATNVFEKRDTRSVVARLWKGQFQTSTAGVSEQLHNLLNHKWLDRLGTKRTCSSPLCFDQFCVFLLSGKKKNSTPN